MNNSKLKIGRIPYANMFPIFYFIDRECDHSEYVFIQGVPSMLNKCLRDGELDISPSSSIEYLRNRNDYLIIPWFSISSSGPIHSILLFSNRPIHELGGEDIALSSESETSVALLKIILKEFLSLECNYHPVTQRSVKNVLSSYAAVLYIGDTAMSEAKKLSSDGATRTAPLMYDLGDLWNKYTGLPFVYALWVVRKDAIEKKMRLIEKFSSELIKAKAYAYEKFSSIACEAPQTKWLSQGELIDYWKIISYDFTDKHMEGLRLFEKHARTIK